MHSRMATARRAGALYFVFMLLGIFGEFLFPTFMVPGDAAATARNILAAETTYRLGILLGLATHVIFIYLVVMLHKLLKEVDRSQALLMVVLVCAGVSTALANALNQFAPLVLLGGGDYLSVFTKPQLDALALGFLRFQTNGAAIPMAFWGVWLFPFGILVARSGFLPRILGYLLMVAGAAYVATSVITIAWPAYGHNIFKYMMPLYMGEVPIIFWLLIKGAKEAPAGVRALETD